MSTLPNTPNTPNNSEEVDLGQLFKLIGSAFDRFFNFIYSIFKRLFLVFIWFVFFIKKRLVILVVAGITGLCIGIFSSKISDPKYVSSVTIVQNYPVGENLYSSVNYYNDLLNQGDFETLGAALNLSEDSASSILSFDVKPTVSENQKLLAFNDYMKQLDSLAASKVDYEAFLDNNEGYTYVYQQISIESAERNSFKSVFENIVESINTNPFFVNEQKKDITELSQKKNALELALVKSDSLQNTYKRVLEQSLNSDKTSEIGITFEGSSDTEKTKEFDLYQSDLALRTQLVQIERDILDKQFIVEIRSNKLDSGSASTSKSLFGIKLSVKFYYGVLLFFGAFIILLGLEFFKFLERYKTSV